MTRLIVFMPPEAAGPPVDWYVVSDGDATVTGDAGQLPERADELDTTVLVSGLDVMIRRPSSRAKSSTDLRTSLLFQVEDDLAEPLDQLHIAHEARPDNADRRWVAICSRTRMQGWLNWLDAHGLSHARLVPAPSLFAGGPSPSLHLSNEFAYLALDDSIMTFDAAQRPRHPRRRPAGKVSRQYPS